MAIRSRQSWITAIGVGFFAMLVGASDVFASHVLIDKAARLRQQTCALVTTIERGYVGAREYGCLVNSARELEVQANQIAFLVQRSCDFGKAEWVLGCMKGQLDRIEDLVDDTSRCAAPKHVRKQVKGLLGQIRGERRCLEDAVSSCRPVPCPPSRGVVIQPYPRPVPVRQVAPPWRGPSAAPVTVGFGRVRFIFD